MFFFIGFFSCSYLFGQDAIEEEVLANAQLFLQKREGNLKSAKTLLTSKESLKSYHLAKFLENKTNKNQLYIHNVGEKQGWIITEKLGNELLVLGYSLTGSFDYDKSIPYLKNWLSVNLDSISVRNSAKVTQNSAKEYYRLEPFLKTKDGEFIQWNQSPYYNEDCPVIDGKKTPVGCAATAMGELMKYWEFPSMSRGNANYEYIYLDRDSALFQFKHTFGDQSYSWDKIPASLTATSTSDEIKETSKLLYDVGLSIKTAYSPEGSGVAASDLVGLQRNFNYKQPAIIHIYDDIGNTKAGTDSVEFHNQIKENLEKKYPVLVIGYVYGGFHAMVCDGYDNDGFYHLSFGWGGQSDGYYHFSENQWCSAHEYLFVDAYLNLIPSKLNYSSSIVNYNAIVKPGQKDSLTIQIEEDDRSFPLYLEPILKLKRFDGSLILPDFSYSFDTTKATVQLKYQTPLKEGSYDILIDFKMGKDTITLANLNLTVDNDDESITRDIQIESIKSNNDFSYQTPTIDLEVLLKNKTITSTINAKSELISDQGVVEYSSSRNVSLTGNSTMVEFEISLQDIPRGNKQLKISIDSDNRVLETNELNNILSVPVFYNREIPVSEWETLKSFYTNSSGETWTHKKNWLSDEPIGTWDGVTVNDGHVTELSNTFDLHKYVGCGYMTGTCESNSFKGSKFPDLYNLSKLEAIDFWFTEMNGAIPPSITNMKSLKTIRLNSCNLSGHLPEDIGKLTNLETLMLEFNNLSGELPSSVFNLTKLENLILPYNINLSGTIDSIGKLQSLVSLRLNKTKIGGKFPADVFNLPKLMEFSANSCLFNGQIPIIERTNNVLQCLDIGNNFNCDTKNQLEGEVFKTLVHCTDMRLLNISNNKFTGTIPSSVVGAEVAREFDLSNNNFDFMEPIVRDTLSPFLTKLNVQNNNLEFQSFESNPDLLKENFFQYSPQNVVGETNNLQAILGRNFRHTFSCGGSNNVYQWFFNGNAFSSASPNGDLVINNVIAENTGVYVCEITNSLVSKFKLTSAPINLTAVTISGVDENFDSGLTIYPNPISSDMLLKIAGLKADWLTVKIIDVLGKVVYQEALTQPEDIQMKGIDISNLKRGVYIIQFENRGESVAKKFVII